MSFFENVPLAPPDPILGLTATFRQDQRKDKVNLGVGLYKNEALETPILNVVKAAERSLLEEEKSKEYLPIDGEPLFLNGMGTLVFGEGNWQQEKKRIAAVQTVGGTSALKIGGTFLKEECSQVISVPTPTWPNHRAVFTSCGLEVDNHPYYDMKAHHVNFESLLSHLEKLPEKTAVMFHASCHNPTGCDPNKEQWKALAELCKRRYLLPFFDFAYQGLGRGLEEDAEALRFFLQSGLEMLVAVSSAKNFSMYGERVGSLFVVANSNSIAEKILSRVKQIIRTTYSNPPMHGAKLIAHVLNTPALRMQWEKEVGEMRKHINAMRKLLCERLTAHGIGSAFSHLARGYGMFGFTGLQRQQVEQIIAEFGIYMTLDGRINVCGLNHKNVDYVAQAMCAVTR